VVLGPDGAQIQGFFDIPVASCRDAVMIDISDFGYPGSTVVSPCVAGGTRPGLRQAPELSWDSGQSAVKRPMWPK